MAKLMAADWVGADAYLWGNAAWSENEAQKQGILEWCDTLGKYISQ